MNVVHGRYCIMRSDQGGPVLRQRGARPGPRLAVRSGREWRMIMARVTLTMQ